MRILPLINLATVSRWDLLRFVGVLVLFSRTPLSHAQPGPAGPGQSDQVVAAVTPVDDRSNWIQYPPRKTKPVQVDRDSVTPKDPGQPAPVAAPTQAPVPAPAAVATPAPATAATQPPQPVQATQTPPAAAPPQVPAVSAPGPVAPGPGIDILAFEFSGNQAVSSEELKKALRHMLGYKSSMTEFDKVSEEVTRVYRQKGLLARADLPRQELSSGVLRIQVTEAVYGATVVQDPGGVLASSRLIVNIIERKQPLGSAIQLEALEAASTLVSELPGVKTQISLQPGTSAGETVALVQVSKGKEKDVQIGLDNHGSRSVGEFRQNMVFNINNPSRNADKLGIQLLNSEGVKMGRLSYSLPVGSLGWRAQAYASSMHYKLIHSDFAALNAEGPSSTQGLELSMPLMKGFQRYVNFNVATEFKRYRNNAADELVSQYKGQSTAFTLESSNQDALLGSQQNSSASWVLGQIDLSPSTAQHIADDLATTQTAGFYQRLRLNHSQRFPLGPNNAVTGQVQAQWASKNLDGAEKFYLGGAQGVRAYPANEGGGSQATLVSVEYQQQVPTGLGNLSLGGFYDWGDVTINKFNDYANAAALNRYQLQGVGVWMGRVIQTSAGQADIKLTWARRIGSNPNANTQGLDQDGSLVLNRYWLNMNYGF